MIRTLLAAALLASTAHAAPPAGNSLPGWTALATTDVSPRDEPYPGTLTLEVDARQPAQGVIHVRETIPVAPGPLTLLYPKWLQGNHAPTGQIGALAGLVITAGGKPVAWARDPYDMFSFRVEVPAGVARLEVSFDYLAPTGGASGRTVTSADMLNLQWEKTLLYPAGHFVRRIEVRPSVLLPDGWTGVSALDGEPRRGRIAYPATDLETLVDSPMIAGRHFREFRLRPGVDLNVFGDRPADIAATPDQIAAHGRIVDQMDRLMGTRHFDRYDFLLGLSDEVSRIGLEHHRSSENISVRGYFTDWANSGSARGLLPHEYEHSWNGKFRRPVGTWRPDYQAPLDNKLLWVYEGQTSFWDMVVATRSGMVPKEVTLGEIASTAAGYSVQAGRAWRALADTTNQPIIAYGATQAFPSEQRGVDYYNEGALIWLEADQLIRARSRGKRSLDDFARAFFGGRPGDWGVVTYDLPDVVAALNRVEPYDWAQFLAERIDRPGRPAPVAGIERGGYRLVWKDTPNPYDASAQKLNKRLDLTHSLGAVVKDGTIQTVLWDGPLFRQGLTGGASIVAVNGLAYSDEDLKGAIAEAKGGREPIRLLVKEGRRYREIALDYHGGPRWPWLEKAGAGEAGLDRLLTPL